PPAPEDQEKTVARPAKPVEPAREEEEPKKEEPAEDEEGVKSDIRTAVMSSFKKLISRDIDKGSDVDPEEDKATVVDERPELERPRETVPDAAGKTEATKKTEPLRRPAAEPGGASAKGPATGRTRQYSPGEMPASARKAKTPSETAPAPDAAEAAARKEPRKGGVKGIWLPSGVILLCIIGAVTFAHLAALPLYYAIYLAAIVAWIWLLKTAELLTLKQAMTIGLLLRVALVFVPPVVASDSLRGLWDGRMVANGLNPYAIAPLGEEVQIDRPGWFSQVGSPEDPTTTPPWALFMFMIVAWIGGGLFFWKLLLLAVDMFTIRLLAREKTGHAVMLYATCPFVILEGVWHGRIELIVICFLVAASWAARNQKEIQGGLFTGIGVGSSFFALPALPALWGTAERMVKMIVATAVTALVPLLIFATEGRVVERFRELLFGPKLSNFILGWLTIRIEQARLAESIAANAEQVTWEPLANALRSVNAADMATTFVGVIFLAILIVVTKRSSGPDGAVANCLGVFFLLTALFTPAGWLLLAPFAIAARQPLWILYALVTPLAYLFPEEGTSWMLLATLYLLPLIVWAIFRDEGGLHLFDSAAEPPAEEPFKESWTPPKRSALY
ncbi:MAG: hypothetical protein R3338_11020, partial [Thermoanaerobaculia bacterium]|nr:hypothetical protein [Thermoanaerobaculia bacterium]